MSDADHRPMSKAELEAYIAEDFIPAMRKMLPVIAPLPEWQPIETAPKDCKTQILAWCKEFDHLFIVNYTGTEGMWYVSCSEGYIRPTHWMPLPNPPIQ